MGIFDIITPAFFCPPQNNEKRLAVLKKNIKFVELEISTFCNRRCFFCGNKDIDRRSANRYMDEDLYLSILQQLQEFQYTGKLAFHRYNEPLADPIIFTRLRQARTFLPEALLCIFTNGDYLDRDMFLHLEELGVREMEISAPYFDEGEVYSPEEARNRIEGR
ncbi:MAG: radical SAM protein, partial [Candidatus Adiutrix sp.]|nr:radical SAM protein [Candidatus Adiutrix sp.]